MGGGGRKRSETLPRFVERGGEGEGRLPLTQTYHLTIVGEVGGGGRWWGRVESPAWTY